MTSSRTVDVLVLGATVSGLTTAVQAAAAGASVLVLDPSEVTPFGFGLATVGMGGSLRTVEVHRGIGASQTLAREAVRAVAWIGDTLAQHGVTPTLRTTYSLAVDGHLAFHLRQEARLLRRGGVAVDVTDQQPLAPLVVRPGLVLADQRQVDPRHHHAALEAAAAQTGVDVVRSAALGRFVQGMPWRVSYEAGGHPATVTASAIVDTNGTSPWGRIGGGVPRTCPVVVAAGGSVSPDIHLLVDTPAAIVMHRRGHTVVVGHPVVPSDRHAATVSLVAFAAQLGLDVVRVRSRPVEATTDGLPQAGRLPLLDGAWLARGFGMWETTLGTAAGLQLGSAVTGGTSALPWAPVRLPAPLALYRRWTGENSDPMVGVPGILRRRGLAR